MGSKLMTASEAVSRFVFDGATIGMGGQSIGRCAMAMSHEIVRQGKRDLTLVGCNLAISMDVLVGAGLVKRTECGTGNAERFGAAFRWRRAIEEGTLEVDDYSHPGHGLPLPGRLARPAVHADQEHAGHRHSQREGRGRAEVLRACRQPVEPRASRSSCCRPATPTCPSFTPRRPTRWAISLSRVSRRRSPRW